GSESIRKSADDCRGKANQSLYALLPHLLLWADNPFERKHTRKRIDHRHTCYPPESGRLFCLHHGVDRRGYIERRAPVVYSSDIYRTRPVYEIRGLYAESESTNVLGQPTVQR